MKWISGVAIFSGYLSFSITDHLLYCFTHLYNMAYSTKLTVITSIIVIESNDYCSNFVNNIYLEVSVDNFLQNLCHKYAMNRGLRDISRCQWGFVC